MVHQEVIFYHQALREVFVSLALVLFSCEGNASGSSSPNAEEAPLPFVKDLRSSNSSVKYQPGDFPGSYDDLSQIGMTPFYEGKVGQPEQEVSSASIAIKGTRVEDDKCVVTDSMPLDESNRQGDVERRQRIIETDSWPYRIHGHVIMKFPNNKTYTGSGILVGPHHVLTAAHNLYDPKKKQWAEEVFFAPGRDEETYPYADSKGCLLLVHENWQKSKTRQEKEAQANYDLGMVILDRDIGLYTGWSGLLSLPEDLLKTFPVSVTGYPGEKRGRDSCATQMWTLSNHLKMIQKEKLFYEIQTSKGQSGSGIWGQHWPGCGDGIYTVGIHTGKEKTDDLDNRGVRLSKEKFNLVLQWLRTYQLLNSDLPELQEPHRNRSLSDFCFLDELKDHYSIEPGLESWVDRAKQGEGKALYHLGCFYSEGKEIPKDPQKAFTCFYFSAQKKQEKALGALGVCYEHGHGSEKNLLKAVSLYYQAKKKKEGCVGASRRLGLLYLKEGILPKKPEVARVLLEEASKEGDAEACYYLGVLYEKGDGVRKNPDYAEELYKKAQVRGYDLPAGTLNSLNPLSKKERLEQAIKSWKGRRPCDTDTVVGYLPSDESSSFVEAVPEGQEEGQEESYLVKLGTLLHQDKELAITNSTLALSGLGGIGKSSLALHYAHIAQKHHLYDFIMWFNAESKDTLAREYRQILKKWGYAESIFSTKENLVLSLSNALKEKRYLKYLFIYDNVPYPKGFKDLFPQGLGHCLMTSRCRAGWKQRLLMDVFSPQDSIDYLMRSTGIEDTEENRDLAGKIAEEVGYLPLALEHVGSYLRNMNTDRSTYSFGSYLKKFREERESLEGYEFDSDESEDEELEFAEAVFDKSKKTVATTWLMTMEQLSGKRDPYKCQELMAYCAYLAPSGIPIDLLKTGKKKEDKKVETGLTLLSDYSLLKRTQDAVSVHRLVQWVIRQKNIKNQRDFLDRVLPDMIINYIQRNFTPDISHDKIWDKTVNVLKHIVSLIDQAKTKDHIYEADHSLLLLGQIMSLALSGSLFSGDMAQEMVYHRVIEKYSPIFVRDINRVIDLGILEDIFKSAHSLIHFGLGLYYNSEQIYDRGINWLKIAASQGYVYAQFVLGVLYDLGWIIDKKNNEAIKWWRKAAQQGHKGAQYCLEDPYGKWNALEKGMTLWRDAVYKENSDAQFRVGMAYYNGEGVEKDIKKAIYWWKKADQHGNKAARKYLMLLVHRIHRSKIKI